jgi:hypothetical protein
LHCSSLPLSVCSFTLDSVNEALKPQRNVERC